MGFGRQERRANKCAALLLRLAGTLARSGEVRNLFAKSASWPARAARVALGQRSGGGATV